MIGRGFHGGLVGGLHGGVHNLHFGGVGPIRLAIFAAVLALALVSAVGWVLGQMEERSYGGRLERARRELGLAPTARADTDEGVDGPR